MTPRLPPRWRLITLTLGWAVMLATAHLEAAAPGQAVTAAVRGVVRDPSGALIPGALVSLTALDTGQQRPTVTSTSEGTFQIVALPPGTYRLTVSTASFVPDERELTLTVDQQLSLDITLELSRPSATVDVVNTRTATIEPTQTSLGTTITARDIDTLPITPALSREFSSLATLTPGVLAAAGGGVVTAGQSRGSNQSLMDGGVLNTASPPPLDAVREFKTVSNHFSAEFGQASGAVVSVVTRSGSNTPAARVNWLQQNSAWNATSPEARQAGVEDPGSTQGSYGGYWGGPIVKDRMFLFATAEQVTLHSTYINTSPVALLFRPDDPLTRPYTITSPKVFARTDVSFSRANQLTGRYSFQRLKGDNAVREPLSTMERGARLNNPVNDVAVTDTHIFGPTVVHEVRVHWNHNRFVRTVDGFCPDCAALNYPSIKIGKAGNSPNISSTNQLDAADTITWLPGRFGGAHAFKAGIAVNAAESDGGALQNAVGTFLFTADIPFDPANAASYPTQFTRSLGKNGLLVASTIVSAFGQDEWQAAPGLTFNLGVRWDHTEWLGPTGGRHDVAPRLGVAFDPWRRGTTVFRAGAGRYYDENALLIARDAEIGAVMISISRPGFQGSALQFDPLGPNPNRAGAATTLRSINQNTRRPLRPLRRRRCSTFFGDAPDQYVISRGACLANNRATLTRRTK